MCPLRLILIFLSATLAGFFVLRTFRSQPQLDNSNPASASADDPNPSSDSTSRSYEVLPAIRTGLGTLVDMATGRYLWTNLVSSRRSN